MRPELAIVLCIVAGVYGLSVIHSGWIWFTAVLLGLCLLDLNRR